MNQLISASLIYDGSGKVHLPDQLLPKADSKVEAFRMIAAKKQLLGNDREVLCEIAGRSCYDSLGAETSRDTPGYHKHILEVKHLSTIEHAALNFNIHTRRIEHVGAFALMFLNRPNVWVRQVSPYDLRVCLNLRHLLEWGTYKPAVWPLDPPASAEQLGRALAGLAHTRAPMIMGDQSLDILTTIRDSGHPFDLPNIIIPESDHSILQLCEPESDEEKWVSLFMTGSRGFSHEQVRHGDWTAISQRSTRFVDENESPWVQHPLITQYLESSDVVEKAPNGEKTELSLRDHLKHVETTAKHAYKTAVGKLLPWLMGKGVDKTNARKQARGAARGYLGNGLYTEVVFSASVAQWRRMIQQRLNQFADAEIREVYAAALPVLKSCRYGKSFEDMGMMPSPDGIGHVLTQGA